MSGTTGATSDVDVDEIGIVPPATRGMRREDIDLASLSLPFTEAPPPPPRRSRF